jgi:4-hydroxy-2-oxoglutarate aldolase
MAAMKRDDLALRGVFPPVPTPFDAAGQIDPPALVANIERWNEHGLAGYLLLGSNGEAAYLSDEEKLELLAAARSAIPRDKLLIAGTGCESTAQTVALTRAAAEAGADLALVVTPHYYAGKMTPEALVAHFHDVADNSSIPVLLYNVPKFTGVNMDPDTIARAGEHPNIVGMKDSSADIAKLGDVLRSAGPDFRVLCGSASVYFAALALGASGGILALANVAPRQSVELHELAVTDRWAEARRLQLRMLPVNAAVTSRFGVAGLKAALDMLGYRGGRCRPPLLDLGASDRQIMRDVLAEAGVLS